MQKEIIFGLGCFWWVQSYFDKIEWVLSTQVGYAGWEQEDATYDDIWDHSEVIKINYDEDQITFEDLVWFFIEKKDPTFPGYKRQYDSLILYNDVEEQAIAKNLLENESHNHDRPINVRVESVWDYYMAEEYHQKFHEKQENTWILI